MKPKVKLKRQRAIKVPLHLKDELEKLLTKLKDADILRETGDDDEIGSLFVNPIILMPKDDYIKLEIDARYVNSLTDLTNYSWPLEPFQRIMKRVNGEFFLVSDLSFAYHQVPFSFETEIDKLHHRWMTIYLHPGFLRPVWPTKHLQPPNHDSF